MPAAPARFIGRQGQALAMARRCDVETSIIRQLCRVAACRQHVHQPAGHLLLRSCRGQVSTPAADDDVHRVAVAAEDAACRRSRHWRRSGRSPCAASLSRALSTTFSVSAAKPTTIAGRLSCAWRWSPGCPGSRPGRASAGRPLALLDLLVRRIGDAPVGDGGGEDGDVAGQLLFAGVSICTARFDRHHLHARRHRQDDRARDQHRLGAQRHGRLGDGIALLARGMVGDVAHRIDRLARRARR